MRRAILIIPFACLAAPALAQPYPPAPPPQSLQLPPELTDPAAMQRLSDAMQALSTAFLNVRIGGVEAALQGREATPRERNKTVGDLASRRDPDFDRHLHEQVAAIGPKMQRGMQAVNRALPEINRSLRDAQESIERAIANMPDPTYPRR